MFNFSEANGFGRTAWPLTPQVGHCTDYFKYSFIHFIHFYIFQEGFPSAKLVFIGPSFKKNSIYKVKYNTIINKEKSSKKLKEENKWCYAIMAFRFL